jgi:hypothetical protein
LRKRFIFLSCGRGLPGIFLIATPLTRCSRKSERNTLRWPDTSAYTTCASRLIYYSDRFVTGEEKDSWGRGRTGEDARRSICAVDQAQPGRAARSENFKAYRQILLRILPDSFDQLLRVGEQLVAVVVKCRVMQEPASGTFAFVQAVGNIG